MDTVDVTQHTPVCIKDPSPNPAVPITSSSDDEGHPISSAKSTRPRRSKRVPLRSQQLGSNYVTDKRLKVLFGSRSKAVEYGPLQTVPKAEFREFKQALSNSPDQ